jgi:hypothetical protein
MKKMILGVFALVAISSTGGVARADNSPPAPVASAPISCPAGYTPFSWFGKWYCVFGAPQQGGTEGGGG